MTFDELIAHEAGHASMAASIGLPMKSIVVGVDGGYVAFEGVTTTLGRQALTILAGLIESNAVPDWPPDPSNEGDEFQLAKCVAKAGMTRKDYSQLVIAALRLSSTKEYGRLHSLFSAALDRWPRIEGRLLEELVK